MEERVRRLERERHHDPSVEARLLRERMRSGDLTADQVRLAAYLGHAPARRVCDDEAPAAFSGDEDALLSWIRGLQAFHPLAEARTAHACAAWAVELHRAARPRDPERDAREQRLLSVLLPWALGPSEGWAAGRQGSPLPPPTRPASVSARGDPGAGGRLRGRGLRVRLGDVGR